MAEAANIIDKSLQKTFSVTPKKFQLKALAALVREQDVVRQMPQKEGPPVAAIFVDNDEDFIYLPHMANEIQALFTGTWIHIQDDHLPPFFDAVGALEEEKQYLLNCQPQIQFEVKGETITITYTQNPTSQPDVKADVSFKLGEEFEFQPEGHLLQVKVEWKDKKVIQHLTPIQSHSAPHIVEFFIDKNKDLVQVYKVTDQNGKEVTGTRKYQRK